MSVGRQVELDLQPRPAVVPDAVPLRAVSWAAAAAPVQPAPELWLAVQVGEAMWGQPAQREALLQRGIGFTPRLSIEADALLLELRGSQRLYGGLRPLLLALRAAFPQPLRLAMAPTPRAALVLARAGFNGCITHPARLHSRIGPLPLAVLRWPEDLQQRLQSMGVACMGDLLRLPRAGLARRIGLQHLRQLDRLMGRSADPRAPALPADRFSERVDPDAETFDLDRLLAALAPTFERLEVFLRSRQRGITALRVSLVHRTGAPTMCVLRCMVAEYRAARFAALLAARLESLRLTQPVRRLELLAGRLSGFNAMSGGLWQPGEQGGSAQAPLPEFLQSLISRLGERAVYGIEPVDEQRPERQWRARTPFLAVREAAMPSQAPLLQSPPRDLARPLGLLPEPVALQDGLRHEGQSLQLVSGPERIESGWWDGGEVRRDYYLARADSGALLWIFRERALPRRWFLHGCFA